MQRSPNERVQDTLSWLHLVVLFLGFISIGWLLTAFDVPTIIWWITFALSAYLGKVGTDGIALGSAWVVGFVSVGAAIKAWPVIWGTEIPYKASKFWASVLLLFWAVAIVLIGLLATAPPCMQRVINNAGIQSKQTTFILIALVWISLATGWLTYQYVYPTQ